MGAMQIDGRLLTQGAGEARFDDAYVLVVDDEVESLDAFVTVLEHVSVRGGQLLIVALDMRDAAIARLERLNASQSPICRAVRAPGFGSRRLDVLDDVAVLTGTQGVSSAVDSLSIEQLGRAGHVEVGAAATFVSDGRGSKEAIRARVDELRAAIHETSSDYDRERFEQRLGNLLEAVTGGEGALPASTQRLKPKPLSWDPWWALRRLSRNWGLFVAGIALVGMGLAFGFVEWDSWFEATRSEHWTPVEGEVVSSAVVQRAVPGSDDHEPYARVRYGYTVNGRDFENDRIRFTDGTESRPAGSWAQAEEDVARYAVGTGVTVYFDSADPARSVLEPGTTDVRKPFGVTFVLPIAVGTVFLLVFVVAFVVRVLKER